MKRFILLISLTFSSLLVGATASAATGYAQTKYPIVLVHGLFGYSTLGATDYFYGMPAALKANGATVYAPAMNPVESNQVRGEELLTAVQNVLAVTGAQKVNLIGHSQGAPTARYVAGVIPANVASVTTIGGVNKGAPFADLMVTLAGSDSTGGLPGMIVNAIGSLIGLGSGTSFSPNAMAAMHSLSTAGSLAFNAQFPNGVPTSACGNGAASVNGQLYYSYTGDTSWGTNSADPLDSLLEIGVGAFLGTSAFADNDTLVGRCSSHFGTVLRDTYPWNHEDEANQTSGLIGAGAPSPVQVMLDQANRLKLAGV